MKTYWKIPIARFLLLLVLSLLLTQCKGPENQFNEGMAAYNAGNYQKAFKLFKSIAEQGYAAAQNNLGLRYHKGGGVPQDYTEAVKWYRKAAEQGLAQAQNNLGLLYAKDNGIPQNHKEAFKLFSKAAEQGLAQAQHSLGFIYAKGIGIPQDYVQADKWFNLSASRSQGKDHEKSVRARNIIEKKMTPAKVAEAQKLAREWKPKT